jgi:hypothetical protein
MVMAYTPGFQRPATPRRTHHQHNPRTLRARARRHAPSPWCFATQLRPPAGIIIAIMLRGTPRHTARETDRRAGGARLHAHPSKCVVRVDSRSQLSHPLSSNCKAVRMS